MGLSRLQGDCGVSFLRYNFPGLAPEPTSPNPTWLVPTPFPPPPPPPYTPRKTRNNEVMAKLTSRTTSSKMMADMLHVMRSQRLRSTLEGSFCLRVSYGVHRPGRKGEVPLICHDLELRYRDAMYPDPDRDFGCMPVCVPVGGCCVKVEGLRFALRPSEAWDDWMCRLGFGSHGFQNKWPQVHPPKA